MATAPLRMQHNRVRAWEKFGSVKDAELVVALVVAPGTRVSRTIVEVLENYDYKATVVQLSKGIEKYFPPKQKWRSEADRIASLMDNATKLRKNWGNAVLAEYAVLTIAMSRDRNSNRHKSTRQAWILDSIKHPQEIAALRSVYRDGLYVISVQNTEAETTEQLRRLGVIGEQAKQIVRRDEAERQSEFGQRRVASAQVADVFVNYTRIRDELTRFFDLIMGSPHVAPTPEEYSMFAAYSASLRSMDLSRQVGAAIWSPHANAIMSVGCNDVPAFGGGHYWPGSSDARDFVKGADANEKKRDEMVDDIIKRVPKSMRRAVKRACLNSSLQDITEFGRAVHAEMDAVLAANRLGERVTGCWLFGTTYPCHNCAKHLVSSGISKMYFIEPYPKSRATELHGDSVGPGRLELIPYRGIGPRRYWELFARRLPSGGVTQRKKYGEVIRWDSKNSQVRVALEPVDYLAREKMVAAEFQLATKGQDHVKK